LRAHRSATALHYINKVSLIRADTIGFATKPRPALRIRLAQAALQIWALQIWVIADFAAGSDRAVRRLQTPNANAAHAALWLGRVHRHAGGVTRVPEVAAKGNALVVTVADFASVAVRSRFALHTNAHGVIGADGLVDTKAGLDPIAGVCTRRSNALIGKLARRVHTIDVAEGQFVLMAARVQTGQWI
jgi:hypothetical protein